MTSLGGRVTNLLAALQSLWDLFLLVTRGLQPLLVVAVIVLVVWALSSDQPWPYAIEAESEHVTLKLAGDVETNWRVDGAQLCLRAGSEIPSLPPLSEGSPCPGRRWQAYELGALTEVTLRLPSAPGARFGYTARLDANADGSLAMRLEAPQDATSALLFAGPTDPVAMAGDLLLRFPPPDPEATARRVLLPFAGAGSIGKDVAWHDPSLLRGGRVYLYTHSDEAAGGRDLVAETTLLPGDRVDLGQSSAVPESLTKGFVHFDLDGDTADAPVLQVVAFGEADAVRIVRYGDQGYTFSPGLVARLSRHSAVATWAVLLLSVLGFMAVYREGSELGQGSYGERRREFALRWRQLWRGE